MHNWNWSWTDQQSRECETSDREFEKVRKKLYKNTKTISNGMASDAFFPFPDSIKMASRKGISCIIQPGGSINDLDVIKAADKLNISMIFTKRRLFSH